MLTRSRSHSREESEAVSDSQSSSGYSSSLSQSQSQEDSAPKEEYVPKKKKPRGRGPPVQPDQWICLMPGRYRPHVPQKNEIVHFENFFWSICFSEKVCAPSDRSDLSAKSTLSFATLQDPRTGRASRYINKYCIDVCM